MAEERTRVIVALGSNIEPRLKYLRQGVSMLEAHPRVFVARLSRIYESQSVEGGGAGDFLNAAAEIEAALSPRELLALCQGIEDACGRPSPRSEQRAGARTLDVDVVAFGDLSSCEASLLLPHPRALWRPFVLRPVLDLVDGEGSGWVRATDLSWEEG